MKKDKTILISSSDLVAEVNAIKYLTHHFLETQNAVKIFSYYESLKQMLNNQIKNYTGLSLFSTDHVELSYTYPVINAYKDMLRKIDNNWWTDRFDEYLEQAYSFLPPAVKFLISDFNHKEAICSNKAMNYPIIRIDSKKQNSSENYIQLDDFKSLITKQNVYFVKNSHDSIITEKEDLNQKTVKKISSIITDINHD